MKDETWQQIYSKAQEIGRFIAEVKEVEIERVPAMAPLRQRVAGAFMLPLKGVRSESDGIKQREQSCD